MLMQKESRSRMNEKEKKLKQTKLKFCIWTKILQMKKF